MAGSHLCFCATLHRSRFSAGLLWSQRAIHRTDCFSRERILGLAPIRRRASDTPRVFIDHHKRIRHRLRALQLKQWKRGRRVYAELRRLGVAPTAAKRVAAIPAGGGATRPGWCMSVSIPATTIEWEYPNLPANLNLRNPRMRTRMSGGVAGSSGTPLPPMPINSRDQAGPSKERLNREKIAAANRIGSRFQATAVSLPVVEVPFACWPQAYREGAHRSEP